MNLPRDDYSFTNTQLETTVEIMAIGTKILPECAHKLGQEVNSELKTFMVQNGIDEDGLTWNVFRFEKIEMPWQSNWIITDVNGFMQEKYGDFYELPTG
jgi:hypothetical protein